MGPSSPVVQLSLSEADARRLTSFFPEIVKRFRPGAPQRADNGTIRVGNKGSLVLYSDGGWFDFEADQGGHGAFSFVVHETENTVAARRFAAEWLSRPGFGSFDPAGINVEAAQARAELYAQRAREAIKQMLPAEAWSSDAPPVGMLNLVARGLLGPYPEGLLGYLDNARLGECALVALLTGVDGTALGVQLGYLTLPNGEKSLRIPQRAIFCLTLDPEERKNALFRIPPSRPRTEDEKDILKDVTLLVEGVEKALAVHMAVPFVPVIGLPGIGRLRHIPPIKNNVIVVRDGDEPGGAADRSLTRGIDHLLLTGTSTVCVTATPLGKDADQIIKEEGVGALYELILTASSTALSPEGEITRLAQKKVLDYALEREFAATRLKITKGHLDKAVDARRRTLEEEAGDEDKDVTPDAIRALWLKPWAEPITDVGAVLCQASDEIGKYVITSRAVRDFVAFWCLFTHFIHHWCIRIPIAARLEIGAVSPECGKTTLLTMTMFMVVRPLPAASLTPATVYRTLHKYKPTLVLDEVDAQLRSKRNPELNAVLRAFHNRLFAIIPRNVRTARDDWDIDLLSGWGNYAYTTTGRIEDDALESRAIKVTLKRATRAELDTLEEIVDGTLPVLQECGQKFAKWALDLTALPRTVVVPKEIAARHRDNWRPFFRLAECIGGEWPQRLKEVALELNGVSRAIGDVVPLLTDIQELYGEREWLTTDQIIQGLLTLPEPSADWSTIHKGRPINVYYLREKLKGLVDASEEERRRGNARGYLKKHFKDAFTRYLIGKDEKEASKPHQVPPDESSKAPTVNVTEQAVFTPARSSPRALTHIQPQVSPFPDALGAEAADLENFFSETSEPSGPSGSSDNSLELHDNSMPDEKPASGNAAVIRQEGGQKPDDELPDATSVPDQIFRSVIKNENGINTLSDQPDQPDKNDPSEKKNLVEASGKDPDAPGIESAPNVPDSRPQPIIVESPASFVANDTKLWLPPDDPDAPAEDPDPPADDPHSPTKNLVMSKKDFDPVNKASAVDEAGNGTLDEDDTVLAKLKAAGRSWFEPAWFEQAGIPSEKIETLLAKGALVRHPSVPSNVGFPISSSVADKMPKQ